MLGVRNYPQEYLDECRAKVEADLAAYGKISAPAALESAFFNNMVIVLDRLFVHRLRTVEGKDGNALNEVRMLCDSLAEHGGKFQVDKTVKYELAKSVLGYEVGAPISLTQADFVRLSTAFFAEMERKFASEMETASG